MANICEVTGKKAMYGNHVSHANNKVRRRFNVNIKKKRFYVPSLDRFVTLKVSAHGIRVITKRGIESVLKQLNKFTQKED